MIAHPTIAAADRQEKTAQDAPGAIFSRGVATRVSPLFEHAATHTSQACSIVREDFRAAEDGVDADRDRGTPRDVTPPTPPGIRVRTTAVRPVEPSLRLEIGQSERIEVGAR